MAKNQNQIWIAMRLMGNLGFQIAIPLVVFGLLGRFLDKKLNSSPFLLLSGLLLSLIITSITIYRNTVEMTKELEDISEDKKLK